VGVVGWLLIIEPVGAPIAENEALFEDFQEIEVPLIIERR